MFVAMLVRRRWLSHRVAPRALVVVLVVAAIEVAGLVIYSFLRPVTR